MKKLLFKLFFRKEIQQFLVNMEYRSETYNTQELIAGRIVAVALKDEFINIFLPTKK